MFVARRSAALAVLVLAGLPAPAAAQFGLFGPNKVQYRHLEWRALRGEHVDLYFYPEEEELARVALTYAENSYRELEARMRYSVPSRVPLFLYASHADFEQTNLLPFVPPEGLLGFTEFGRSRVVLPFRGSYAEFRHTIRHELVHAFQLSKTQLMATLYPRLRHLAFPLWWSEGLAEFWSAGEDTQDEMILRDLTQGGRLPTIEQLDYASGGIVYPVGGSLMRFLADSYGEWRIVQAYDDAWKYDSFGDLIEAIFGKSEAQLTAEWHYAMRRRYYPLIEEQRPLALDARRIAEVAVKPVVWTPPGDSEPQVLYLSPRTGYTDVYSRPLSGGRVRTVIRGERSSQFESFHAFESRLDVSPQGVLVFASRYLDRDALFFYDLVSRRTVGRYQFPEIVSILSPSWAPDGRSVVFSGLSFAGFSDLYLLHLPGGSLERLTSDRYQDIDPSFSPDGTRIVFASDRTPFGSSGALNLFVLDLGGRIIRYLTYGDWRDRGPRWESDGRIVFTSDRRGVQDIYAVDSAGAGRRETGVPGGTFDPVWVAAAGRYVFGGFENLQFNIYTMRPATELGAGGAAEDSIHLAEARAPAEWRWAELDDPRYAHTEPARYERKLNVEFAAADAAIVPGIASAQGATVLLSDLLVDHVVAINVLAYQQGTGLGDLISNFNGTVVYVNQSRRLNWGVGAFRVRGRFYEGDFDRIFDETAGGAFFLLRYPLSRFARVESRMQAEYSDRTDFGFGFAPGGVTVFFPHRRGILTSNFLSYVWDNSLWLPTGPIDGGRINVTGGIVTDLTHGRFDDWIAAADARRYLRTGLRTALALRGYVFLSGGERPNRVALGGSLGLRGYPRYIYVAGSRAVLFNGEWRFPITDYLTLGFPFGEWRFPGIQGAFFADAGKAWTGGAPARGLLGSYGIGMRMNLGIPLVLRLDFGWRYGDVNGEYQLPLNYRRRRFVDFWFGFNY